MQTTNLTKEIPMRTSRRHILILTATALGILSMLVSSPLLAGKGGNGGGHGGGGSTSQLPNMAFELTYLPLTSSYMQVQGLNNELQVVGWYVDDAGDQVGFVYDHSSGIVLTLDDLISTEDRTMLAARGFNSSKFRGINDDGIIVGYAGAETGDEYTDADGLIIDMSTGSLTLTSSLGYSTSYLLHINNANEVVGGYLENDDWENAFVASFDATTESLSGAKDLGAFSGMIYGSNLSDSGVAMLRDGNDTWEYNFQSDTLHLTPLSQCQIVGKDIDNAERYVAVDLSRASNGYGTPVIVDPATTGNGIVWTASRRGLDCHINDPSLADLDAGITIGDVIFSAYKKRGREPIYLYSPAWGELAVDDLIEATTEERVVWEGIPYYRSFLSQKLPNTNFGAIAGSGGALAYLLVPVPFDR